jgi:hypothetical protein
MENDRILAENGVYVDRSNTQEMIIRMKNPGAEESLKFIVQRNLAPSPVSHHETLNSRNLPRLKISKPLIIQFLNSHKSFLRFRHQVFKLFSKRGVRRQCQHGFVLNKNMSTKILWRHPLKRLVNY